MFEYDICTVYDEDVFNRQCAALETRIPELLKGELLTDVDGTQIQEYTLGNDEVLVLNDVLLGVIVRSGIDLTPRFETKH